MNRLPAVRQVRLLTQIRAGQVTSDGDQYVIKTASGKGRGRNVTDRITALRENGWIQEADERLVLTSHGESSLADAEAIARVAAIPAAKRPRAQITRRSRGNRTYGSRSRVPDGRNVTCHTCYQQQKADHEAGLTRYQPDPVVWFTNEGGREADREAEIALAWHIINKHQPEATQQG